MTDVAIEKVLTEAFLSINQFMIDEGFTGTPYITMKNGKPANVSLPNQPFTEPTDKRFFVVDFLPASPEPMGLGVNAENYWTGILQIDVVTPLGGGKAESENKYNWISRLFSRGKVFDRVTIKKCYRAMEGAEPNLPIFRTIIRIEWYATLPKD